MFAMMKERESVEECKEKGNMVKAMSWEYYFCSSILNRYERGKIAFVKAREKVVAIIKMQDDERFSHVDG